MPDLGSAREFQTDVEAIISEAPDVQSGLDLIKEEYLKYEWDDPAVAQQTLSQGATRLRQKFYDNTEIDYESAAKAAPIGLSETPNQSIDEWQQLNQEFLDNTTDPDYLLFKDQIKDGIDSVAERKRREDFFAGEQTGSLSAAVTSTAKDILDVGARQVLGAFGGALDLVGADSVKTAIERYTDPAYDGGFQDVIAKGSGQAALALLSGGYGGTLGTYGYLGLQGGGAVREQYEDTLKVSGRPGLATATASVEAANQIVQTAVGGKIFGPAGQALAQGVERTAVKTFGQAAAPVIVTGLKEGFTEGAGSVVSTATKQYGRGQPLSNADYSSALLEGAAGFIFGGTAEIGTQYVAKSKALNPTPEERQDTTDYTTGTDKPLRVVNQQAPIDLEMTQDLQNNGAVLNPESVIETAGGTKFIQTEDGELKRQAPNGTVYETLDGTFYISPENAAKLSALEQDPETRIYASEGKLYVSGPNITPDFKFEMTPETQTEDQVFPGKRVTTPDPVGVETEDTTYAAPPKARQTYEVPLAEEPKPLDSIVQASEPKNLNGNTIHEAVFISPPITRMGGSVGAARRSVDPKMGGRFRNMEGFTDEFRNAFEENDYGYVPFTKAGIIDEAGKTIDRQGVARVVTDLLNPENNLTDPYDIALIPKLMPLYTEGIEAARAAGDTEAANRLAQTQAAIASKVTQSSSKVAQALNAYGLIAQIDPTLRLQRVEDYWVKATSEEFAKQAGLTPKEVQNIDRDIEATTDTVNDLRKATAAEENKVDERLNAVTSDIKTLEALPEEQAKEFEKQQQKAIDDLNAEIERLKSEDESKADAAEAARQEAIQKGESDLAKLEAQHQEITSKLEAELQETKVKLEQVQNSAQEQAKTTKEQQLSNRKTVLEKNRGKLSPEDATKAEEGLKAFSEQEPAISKQDKELIKELQRKAENAQRKLENENIQFEKEKGKLEPLVKRAKAAPKIPKLKEKTSNTIKELENQIRLREEKISQATPDSFDTKTNQNKLKKLKEERKYILDNRDKLRAQRISKDDRAKLKAAEEKLERLKSVKDKFQAKLDKKLENFTPEKKAKLGKLFGLARDLKGAAQQKVILAAAQLENDIFNEAGVPALERPFYSFWILNNLSGPGTQATNVFGNFTQSVGDLTGVIASQGIPGAKAYFNGVLTGLSQVPDVIAAEWYGNRTFKPELVNKDDTTAIRDTTGPVSLDKNYTTGILRNFGPDFLNAKLPKVLEPFRMLGYVGRALRAMDAAFYTTNREAMARVIANKEGIAQKKSGQSLRAYVSNELGATTAQAEIAMTQARKDITAMRDAGIDFGGLDYERAVRNHAYELLEAQRSEKIRVPSNRLAQQATLTNKPEGAIGVFAEAIGTIGRYEFPIKGVTIRPFQWFTAFTNVAANIANRSLDFTPVGAARSLAFYGDKTNLERQIQFGKFMFGTAALSTFYAGAKAFLDDDDPAFAVFAEGPADFNARKQWKDAGGKPYSIKWGDQYYDYSNTAIGLPMAALGGYFDVQRQNRLARLKGNQQNDASAISLIITSMGKNFTEQSFMKTLGDTVKAIQGEPGYDWVNVLAVNPARGLIPAKGALVSAGRLFQNPIDTKQDYWAKFISGIPVVQNFGTKPALNAFGEEVSPTFTQRLDVLSRFYSERVSDPAWRWLAANNYTIPKPSSDLTFKSDSARESRAAKVGAVAAGNLTTDEAYELAKTAGPRIKDVVLKYQTRYGISGFKPKVQKDLNEEINKIINQVKKDIATR